MQLKKGKGMKRVIAFCTCFALLLGGLSFKGASTVTAATTELTRADNSIVYFVDCGDYVTSTVCSGDQLGTRNSVTDQAYGVDAQTGFKWGIVDSVSSPLTNGTSGKGGVDTDHTWAYESNAANADVADKTSSNRYTKNQWESDKTGVRNMDYKFEVSAGTYQIETYTVDPWNCSKSPTLLINSIDPTADFLAGKGVVMTARTVTQQAITMGADGEIKVSYRASGDANKAINVCYIKIVKTSTPVTQPPSTATPTATPAPTATTVPTVKPVTPVPTIPPKVTASPTVEPTIAPTIKPTATPAPTLAPTPTAVPNNAALDAALSEFDKTTVTAKTTIYKAQVSKVVVSYSDEFIKAIAGSILTIKSITYTSANSSVASVSSSGEIKGLKKGSTVIHTTITTSTGKSITRDTAVTVKNPEIKISGKTTVKKGKSIILSAKLYGVSGKVSWSVNNKKIAKISSTGKLKGLKKGSVVVTAKVKSIKNSVRIKVK